MARWARKSFRGIDTELDTHLIEQGHVADMRNLTTQGGRLQTRRGFVRASDISDEIGPLGVERWPNLIFSFDPVGTAGPADDGSSGVDMPDDPYGTVETPPDPTVDDGTVIGGVDVPGTGGDGWIPDPDDPDDPVLPIQAALPATVVDRCRFAVNLACTGFDGTGAAATGYAMDAAGTPEAAGLNLSPAVTGGWAEGLWSGTGLIEVDTDIVALYLLVTATDRPGVSASATVSLPTFAVTLPALLVAGETFAVAVACEQDGYEGDGHGLSLSFERWDAAAEEWVALSVTGLASLASGWSEGAWSDSAVTLGDLEGSELVRAVLSFPGRDGDETATDTAPVDLGETATVDLPDYVNGDEEFTFDLAMVDGAGNALPDFDTTRLSFRWEYAASAGGPWYAFAPNSVSELAATLPDGTATVTATLSSALIQEDGYLRLTAILDAADSGQDTARLDFQFSSHALTAIYERQQAAGVVAGSLIDPEGSYTLAQLCTEANKFTGATGTSTRWMALAGWTDKTAQPDYLTDANYFGIAASGATVEVADEEELYAEVVKFQTSRYVAASSSGHDSYSGNAIGAAVDTPWAEVLADVAADWTGAFVPGAVGAKTTRYHDMYGYPAANAYVKIPTDASDADTRIARTLELWMKGATPSGASYDNYGCGAGNGYYGRASQKALAAAASNALDTVEWTGYPGVPSPWCGEDASAGWEVDGNLVVVVEWEFSD